ncbi:MAG: MFS transporter [Acholeplasmataceae bacterium]|nr:MFS transporter [Acholeplasmataceae bacterium]
MKNETRKYKLAHIIRYIGDAFFYPFFALYLSTIGKTKTEIGLILMILPLVGIFINPLWSLFSKNINSNRIFVIILSIIEAAAIFYLIQVQALPFVVIGTLILAIVGQPYYTLFDGYTTIYSMQNKVNYSSIRLYGSLGFAVGILISGYVIEYQGYELAFIIAASLYILVSLLTKWIKPINLSDDLTLNEKPQPKQLVHNKKFLLFVGFYAISMAVIFGSDSFLPLFFETKGIGPDGYGWISFFTVILELIFLLLLSKFGSKIKLKWIMMLIALLNALRYFIFSLDTHIYLLIASSLLRSLIIGGLLYVAVAYMQKNVSKKNITLGMMIYGSIKSAYQALLTLWGGYQIDHNGYFSFYIIVTILAVTALFFIDYREKADNVV